MDIITTINKNKMKINTKIESTTEDIKSTSAINKNLKLAI